MTFMKIVDAGLVVEIDEETDHKTWHIDLRHLAHEDAEKAKRKFRQEFLDSGITDSMVTVRYYGPDDHGFPSDTEVIEWRDDSNSWERHKD